MTNPMAAIAALSPVAHWPFQDPSGPADAIGGFPDDLPNRWPYGTVDYWHVTTQAEADHLPCGGGAAAQARYWIDSNEHPDLGLPGADWRHVRGTKHFDGIDADLPFASTLPFPLFSQSFTLLWYGSGVRSYRHMGGTGSPELTVDGTNDDLVDEWASVLWSGDPRCEPGGDQRGVWFTLGNMQYRSGPVGPDIKPRTSVIGPSTSLGARMGVGVTPIAYAYGGGGGGSGNDGGACSLNAFVYDASKPVLERVMMWGDGWFSGVTNVAGGGWPDFQPDATELLGLFEALAAQDSSEQLAFFTGWSPEVLTRYADAEGYETFEDYAADHPDLPTEDIYPFQSSYGFIANVALLDRAMTHLELRDLWVEAGGGTCIDDPVCQWRGRGPNPRIVANQTGPGDFDLDGSTSTADYGIASYAWHDDITDDPLGSGTTVSVTVPVDGYRRIRLTVTDTMGLSNSATVELSYDQPPATPATYLGRIVAPG